ncbi:MAG TPA: alcohol dehydrogenase catalytic domain-containing protein, partial [Thermoanaerobaculia bacterium]
MAGVEGTTLAAPADVDAPSVRMAVLTADGEVRLEERPLPPPGPGEMRLRLRCAGLCGTDLWKLRHKTAPAGTVLGHEIVGTVEAKGDGVVGFAVGDRVVAPHHVACGVCAFCRAGSEPMCAAFRENQFRPGGFSERLTLGERAVRLATFGLPASLADEAAVFLEPAACVLRGLRRVPDLAAGSTAAVLGAGSMGLLHLLVLRAALPGVRVLVVDPLADRRELALTLGADVVATPGESA